ncbi:MAG: glycosyl hydrolase family 18 protein [Pseudobdellovibrio sp.]
MLHTKLVGRLLLSIFLTMAYTSKSWAAGAAESTEKIMAYYFATWSENSENTDPSKSILASLPSSINMLMLAFAKPGAVYSGDGNLEKTGLDYDSDLLKGALKILRANNPKLKVILSVGGWQANWKQVNYVDLARLVSDYGLDGIDIDYEPPHANCKSDSDGLRCSRTDDVYVELIKQFRAALPRPLSVSIAGWSNGAYGLDEFKKSKPVDQYSGLLINPLKQVGDQLDQINLMSYNGGTEYSPVEALQAYKKVFTGPIVVGVQAPPESRNHVITVEELHSIAAGVLRLNGAGMMVWAPWTDPQKYGIDAKVLLSNICQDLGLSPCEMP